jgi:hypothetical protein
VSGAPYCDGCLEAVLDQISEHAPTQQMNTLLMAMARVIHQHHPAQGHYVALGLGTALGVHLLRLRREAAIGPVQGHA